MRRAGTGNTVDTISFGCGGVSILIWLYFAICWVVNLFKFIACDFDAPYKEEIIHGIGVFTFFPAGITVWF